MLKSYLRHLRLCAIFRVFITLNCSRISGLSLHLPITTELWAFCVHLFTRCSICGSVHPSPCDKVNAGAKTAECTSANKEHNVCYGLGVFFSFLAVVFSFYIFNPFHFFKKDEVTTAITIFNFVITFYFTARITN